MAAERERGRVQIVGIDDQDHPIAQTLRAAGYAVLVGMRALPTTETQVALVMARDLSTACRSARAALPGAHVVACVGRDEDQAVGEVMASGADDVLIMTPPRAALIARVRAGIAQVDERRALERARHEMELIGEIATLLGETDLVEGLFDASARIAETLGFERCTVLLLPGDDSSTIFLVAASDDAALTRLPLDLRKYPELRAAIDTREPVFIPDAATSELLGDRAELAALHGGTSLLCVPLAIDRRVIGALQLRSHMQRPPLSREQGKLLSLLARFVTLALRDGRIEALREATRRVAMGDFVGARRLRALDHYRDFFESAGDGMFVVDGRGEVLYVNRAAEQMTGYAASGLVGHSVEDVVAISQRPGLAEVVQQASLGTHLAGFDLQLVTTSGEPLLVSVSTSRVLPEHGVVALSFRDVTLARALEEELRKTKDFLERLIDSTVDAIIAADIRGRIILFNQGAERLFGYSADEVIGKLPVWQLYAEHQAKEIMALLRAPEHGGVGRLLPMRREIRARDGSNVPILLTASILYEDNRESATVGVMSDLRERIKIEERLAQAQEKLLVSEKQALIADLAGTTAHELNQPLTSVMGYAELLQKRMSPDDSNMRAVEIILREAERMAAIVRKIGKITRYETKAYVGTTTILDLDKSADDPGPQ